MIFEAVLVDVDGTELQRERVHNLRPDEACNHILDVVLAAGSQVTAWFLAPLKTDHTPAGGDTYANSMSTSNYESTDYSESTRQQWMPGTVASKSVDNTASVAEFTMGGVDSTVYGMALVSVATKNDAGSGVLFSISQFDNPITSITAGRKLYLTAYETESDDGV